MTKNNLKVVKTAKDKELENKEKNKALDAAISQITDSFGKGSVMKLGEQKAMDVESISTGSLSLDLALGIGGLPKGRIIEIYGPESSGKTTLGKIVGGGFPIGVICGKNEVMEHANTSTHSKKTRTYIGGGTFSANPLSMMAGSANLDAIKKKGNSLYKKINLPVSRNADFRLHHTNKKLSMRHI